MEDRGSGLNSVDVIYKLGTLEVLVSTGMENIKEQLKELKQSTDAHQLETKREVEEIKTRLDRIEDWKKAVVERITIITGLGLAVWAFLGDVIKQFIYGRIF